MASSLSTSLRLADRFDVFRALGDGSFGTVTRARVREVPATAASDGLTHLKPNTVVAIKSMKKKFADPADYLRLREVLFLRTLPPHENLVRAHEIFLDLSTCKLHIIMECLDMNLYQFLTARNGVRLELSVVRSMLVQISHGLYHIHEHGYFHRDVKPENILVTIGANSSTVPIVKLSDFGLVRDVRSDAPYTGYVSTRWYRAPEILLKAGIYGMPVDIWALGAVGIEIATLRPCFPGQNEWDQIVRVCEMLGSPDSQSSPGGSWPTASLLATKLGFVIPTGKPAADIYTYILSSASDVTTLRAAAEYRQLASFVSACLRWDPKARPTIAECLEFPFLTG
ncbi:kinase-like domain-containing protein, partial [Limtongia smithiae]|uniref:kinase-like domain-containing protein n=1 Tax=Limtongia smithiae TaxID=1125753 RepID=UPI0034CF0D38